MSMKRLCDYLGRRLENLEKEDDAYAWKKMARPNQCPPAGDWRVWVILAGRGFGKTGAGAETLRSWILNNVCKRVALVAETDLETRQVMVEGPSGLLAVHSPTERPSYNPSRGQLFWSNGAVATCFSAEAYERLRGPQFDGAWVDELAKFKDPADVWDQLMFGLRLGKRPRVIVTTTPRPSKFLKTLLKDPSVRVTPGSTFENAKNLAKPFLDYIKEKYAKTRLGRQELYAEYLEDSPGSLWNRRLLDTANQSYQNESLKRIVVGVDPAVSHGEHSDETGIIVAGITAAGQGVILDDRSLRASPSVWIQRAIGAYHHWKADRMIAEVNMGGELVEHLLRSHDPTISYKAVHAMRGKALRAEPIAALYEQGKVWHARAFPELEDQLCSYVPGQTQKSPDRLDALVWALTELMLTPPSSARRLGISS